ncbi:hypothetical protein WH52_07015 [Tenacibaculum holothuriorum]|uniref:BioF2-like acetyltransferase domain-containing protein n=1 Tax=Tenacibaculum holothuriorum TaxID=1635173 RepID=A0A1Y2PDD0_9FLAO|nr:hypothetical protein [Tenacibaculum holothuriorum]OSY88496.1 hypothetical protein WH52_07015 [Tenacibaculum holothuriorum]
MIFLVERKDLDIVKYDNCIENSLQGNIFVFSWYLDIACDNWSVLVLEDYIAVMPLPWRKKLGIKYVYPPLWVLQLGVFSTEVVDENEFLIEVFHEFKYVEQRTNSKNSFSMFEKFQLEKTMQVLSLETNYDTIFRNYNRNRKRELKKAQEFDLVEKWNDAPENLIELFKQNVGKRLGKGIRERDYNNLFQLIKICKCEKKGEVLSIYDKNNQLVSSAFFVKLKNRVTEVVCSSDFSNRSNGANTFMNDRAIFKYQPHFKIFDFGGSSMKNIAKYYRSFGATDEKYIHLHYNNLPKILRLFKR